MSAKKMLFVFSLLVMLVSFCSGEVDQLVSRSVMVRIETDPQFMRLTEPGISSLLNSMGVAYKAYEEVLDEEGVPENLNITNLQLGVYQRDTEGKLFIIFLRLNPENTDEMVLAEKHEEILQQIVENFRQALMDSYAEHMSNVNERVEILQKQASEAEAELRELMDGLPQMMGMRPEELQRRIAEMEEGMRDTQFELGVNEQLMKSLHQRKEQMRHKLDEQKEHDEVQQQMKEMLKQLEEQMKTMKMMVDSGARPVGDIEKIEKEMIQARIQMARRAEEMRNEIGGHVLAELDEQIAQRGLEMERMRMRAEHMAQSIEQNEMVLEGAADREIRRIKMDAARQNFARTLEFLNEAKLKQKLQMPPKVIVIEGKGD